MSRRSSLLRAACVLLLIAVVLSVGFTQRWSESSSDGALRSDPESNGEVGPTALGRHMEALKQTIPGNGGEPGEGPGSAAEAEFEALAYPDNTVSIAEMDAARASFSKATGRPFPKGKGRPGTWVSVGPSQATYPFSEYRGSFNYVPNEYVAGGRTTSIAISETCKPGDCRMYITPAGGGVWRTDNALADELKWTYLGGPLGINAAGSVTIDSNDPSGKTIYVGTGGANICGSGCVAGVGLYKSTDGGATWSEPIGKAKLGGKGIGSIVIAPGEPKTIYVGTTTALRGMSSVCCSGVTRPVPDAAKWGLYKSTDGGTTWSFIHNGAPTAAECTGSAAEFANGGTCSPRGVRQVVLDPTDPKIVYAASYARGVWRSTDGGASWGQIKPSLNRNLTTTRPAIAVTKLANGKTRMYIHEGNAGAPYSRLFRSDDVAAGAPEFLDLTSANPADAGYATYNLCGGQCWYDLFVYTPKEHPDIVYLGGSYSYGQPFSNKRAVILSTDAGVSGTDMTMDGTDPIHPNGLHPDQHALVTNPNNPFQFFETNDGGAMRSSGTFTDVSTWCGARDLAEPKLGRCQQVLSRVPSKLESLNKGLTTLQFQSLSVSPHNVNLLQGGTQDNGTWESNGNPNVWLNTMIGDGGQSGFDVAKPAFRFHNFFDASTDVNFDNADIGKWIWISDPIYGTGAQFYAPVISDPKISGTLFAGTANVWRTKTHGLGTMTYEEAQQHCNEWTGDFKVQCGDWAQIATPELTAAARGDRQGGSVAAIERTTADTSTAWAATTTGRIVVSKNVDAEPASAVTWTRIDQPTTPNRFVSSIYVDPENPNRAWVSYSGFNANTPATPGHVFEVTYDPATGTARWVDRSHDFGDVPVTDLVRDDVTGDLYASSDFGVMRLAGGTTSWTLAAPGMPNVEVAGLTIVPSERKLYAASHGLSAWALNLR